MITVFYKRLFTTSMKKIILSSVLLTLSVSYGQNVGINSTGAAATNSAALDVDMTNKGILIPRVALTTTSAFAPVTGTATASLLVYNTATAGATPNNVTPGYYYWDGLKWTRLLNNGTAWLVGGNYNGATGSLGTLDNNHIDLISNGVVRGRLSNVGEFFIGTTSTSLAGDLMNGVGNATFPWAINGYTAQNGGAVYGSVTGGTSNFSSVQAEHMSSGTGSAIYGVNATTNTGTGLSGIQGTYQGAAANGGYGVSGYNASATGNQRIGLMGQYNGSAYGIGVYGIGFGGGIVTGNNDIAVVGWRANNSNYSGYFNGNHVIANGTKSASVGTEWGNQLLYVTESPEVWFEDIGRGTLVNGQVTIELDSIFRQVTFVDDKHPMHVFIQLEGECNDVYVVPGTTSFVVKEKNGGTSNVNFSYRVMAKRVHFQDHRYGNDPVWGEGDTRPYMEYATPPNVDYNENLKLQEEKRANWKQGPVPAGFKTYEQLKKEAEQNAIRNPQLQQGR